MKILHALTVSILIFGVFVHDINADELEEDNFLNKYKYELFLINPTESKNKFLYTAEELGGIGENINRVIEDVRIIINPGSYIRITDFYYNASTFKLNSILYNKENSFYLDLKGASYYYIIYCDKNMFPQLRETDNISGYNMVKEQVELKK